MKKTALITAIVLSTLATAQKKEYKFFENDKNAPDYTTAKAPGDPGDPVPIDGYVPLLLLVSLGLAAYYGKQKITGKD